MSATTGVGGEGESIPDRQQAVGETFDDFYAALVMAVQGSDPGTSSELQPTQARQLRNAILKGIGDPVTRDQLRRMMPDLTLANAIALCRMADLLRTRSTEAEPSGAVTVAATAIGQMTTGPTGTASTEAIVESSSDMESKHMCGISCWHPKWLQKYSNTSSFLVVYGLLGTIQSMAFLYFVVTLTTIEKRFKIPSYTTGIVISGNEISQILLSLILSYAGGQRNRPRWIAWGVVFCALSCFILALPHFIYGPGDDALHLTEEYLHRFDSANHSASILQNTTGTSSPAIKSANKLCTGQPEAEECDELFSYVPLVLIFVSQFVLGIGTTLYYTLGQTYLDDNTKKTNTPMMLAYAMSLRMFGPVVGFLLGFISLRMYIDPWKTPLINNKDPRWLGAWWFGWILLGFAMLLFSWLIGMFPKELPKLRQQRLERDSLEERPRFMRAAAAAEPEDEEKRPFRQNGVQLAAKEKQQQQQQQPAKSHAIPQLKDFPAALMRLLRNKLLMYNILSGVFYILGSSGSITFLSKYMEVQFNKNASDATIVTGPITLLGMVSGFLISGWVISKYRPGPRKLFFWNVLVGACYIGGQFSNLFLTCDSQTQLAMPRQVGAGRHGELTVAMWNLTRACNADCSCDAVPYSPVCDEATGTTYFSPCHAGCHGWDDRRKVYQGCACSASSATSTRSPGSRVSEEEFTLSLDEEPLVYDAVESEERGAGGLNRSRRATGGEKAASQYSMLPGACMAGCAMGFYIFTAVSCVINWLGATGRIGNILLNFRVVSVADKSFSQGLALMMISLFALIPGPILYGHIIDSSCLIWNSKCGQRGNCQLYDARQFRYYLNLTAMSLTAVGVFFDVLVWWYGKDVDLYGEREAAADEGHGRPAQTNGGGEFKRRHQPITPLMTKKA